MLEWIWEKTSDATRRTLETKKGPMTGPFFVQLLQYYVRPKGLEPLTF